MDVQMQLQSKELQKINTPVQNPARKTQEVLHYEQLYANLRAESVQQY